MRLITGSLILVLLALSIAHGGAQAGIVHAKFKVDGKESKDKFRIILYVNDEPIEPTVSDDGNFLMPVVNLNKIDIRFISGEHDLRYDGVYVSKLRGTLTFGVRQDLSKVESHCKPTQKLVAQYSIEFDDDDAEATAMTIDVCV
jgi:hypothetical protein